MKENTENTRGATAAVAEHGASTSQLAAKSISPIIRAYRPEDRQQIEDIHVRLGVDCKFPDLDSPLCMVKLVEEIDGVITGALVMRVEVEALPWLHPEMSPEAQRATMARLQEPSIQTLYWEKGIDVLTCRVQDATEKRLAENLPHLGWSQDRDGWTTWSRGTTKDGK